MVLNSTAVLDAFLCALRLLAGAGVVGLGVLVLRRSGRPSPDAGPDDRAYLLYLLAAVLVALDVLSWPFFYLLLQSYVPEWEGVMCVYGVTRIGTGSVGPSRFLPGLLAALEAGKPAVVFAAGTWAVLYAVNRPTRTAPLTPRVLLAAVVLGLVSVLDAAAEGAYLLIPKKDDFLSAGCCTAALDGPTGPTGLLAGSALGSAPPLVLGGLFYAANAALCLALAVGRLRGAVPGFLGLTRLAIGAMAALAVSAVFLVDVAAPLLLRMPGHHCPYDLIPEAPGSVAAVAVYLLSSFCVGWAWVVGRFGTTPETAPFAGRQVGRLLGAALVATAASVSLVSVQLLLV
ncbi:MAG: hypothetical protein K2X82_17010 [Gemmataceae bacterium]|nr:hypothetical protein [Gemmataceae bacterium]